MFVAQTRSMADSARMIFMQAAVKRMTDINSALRTIQACMILLFLRRLSTLASEVPYFKLFSGE
jgi:hypothetical protein